MFPVQLSSPAMPPGSNPFAVLQAQHQKLQQMDPNLYNNITSMMQPKPEQPQQQPQQQSIKKTRTTKNKIN